MKETQKIKVGITHGDTNGIGYEVILKMLEDLRIAQEICTPIIYGSGKMVSFYRKGMNLPDFNIVQISSPEEAKNGEVNLINVVPEDVKIEVGTPTKTAGKAAFDSLERAVSDLRSGAIDVLLTAPINKDTIQSDTFCFPGHTEYLEASIGDGAKSLMILCNDTMRVALVTTHLPLAKVPEAITKEAVVEKLRLFNTSLKRDFGVEAPRIAVLSLNPHAGENGLLGKEEQEIIVPAIAEAEKERILAFGPYASDGFFGSGAYKSFDGILAMYHDQGLTPFKTLAMNDGVNFTAGLPFVRTSPDHGTGYDIAGQGVASPDSMRKALYYAIDIFRNRNNFDYAIRRPLRKQHFEKGKDNVVLDLTKDDEPIDA